MLTPTRLCFSHDVKLFVQRHQYVYWMSYGVFLVTYITLMCCGNVRRKHPWNMILLTLFVSGLGFSGS